MAARRLPGSFWPSGGQRLLLVTALAEAEDSLAAWRELRPRFDLDDLERGSFTLLPLVHRALARAGVEDALMPRLKGIYRSTWTKNNLLLERARASIELLDAEGVPALLVGGLACGLRFYGDVGLRPTPSVDLLVERRDAAAAASALSRAGWSAGDAPGGGTAGLSDPDGRSYVLRTSLAPDFVLRADPERTHVELWTASQPLDLRGTRVRALAPGDELLAACVTGARSGPAPNVQWIGDAAQILQTAAAEIDWDRLLRLAGERGQSLRLRDALTYLGRLPAVSLPAEVRGRLEAMPATPRERLAHLCSAGSVRGLGSLPQALGEHLLVTADRPVAEALAGVPRVLRERWDVEHGWELPLAGGRRAARLLVGSRGRSL